MPKPDKPVLQAEKEQQEVEEQTPVSGQPFREILDVKEEDKDKDEDEEEDEDEDEDEEEAVEVPYIVISGDSEITVESAAKIKALLKKRVIFSYDEVRHPSLTEERTSVGELLESLNLPGRNPLFWVLWGLAGAAAAVAALEFFEVLDFFTWLP